MPHEPGRGDDRQAMQNLTGAEDRPIRIMAIDDEALILKLICVVLRSDRYAVQAFESASEAWSHLQDGARFDVIMTDVAMPELNGTELFTRLQEHQPDQARRLIFTTGDPDSPALRAIRDRSDNPILRKPFAREDLIDLVETVARSGPAPSGAGMRPCHPET